MFSLPKNTLLGHLELEYTFQYFDIPRLFTCKSRSGSRFLAVSTFDDYETFEWLYLPISNDRFSSLLSKSIDLRTALQTPEDGYLFTAKLDYDGEGTVVHIFPDQIDHEDLPESGAFIETSENVHPGLGHVEPKLAATSSKRETCNFHFYPWDTRLPELDVKDLGRVLTSFQDLADSLGQYCKGETTLKGVIPAEITEATKFRATQIFDGSFGLQLKSKANSDLFHASLASEVLSEFINLLEARDSDDLLSNKLHSLKGRVASRYRKFLQELYKISSPIKIDWGSPNLELGSSISLSKHEIKAAYELVSRIDVDMSEAIEFKAELLGLDVKTKRYRVRHLDENEDYSGKIAEDSISSVEHSEINAIYTVVIKKIIETNSSSGSELTKWLLIDLKSS